MSLSYWMVYTYPKHGDDFVDVIKVIMVNISGKHGDDYRSWKRVIEWKIITENMMITVVADNELLNGK